MLNQHQISFIGTHHGDVRGGFITVKRSLQSSDGNALTRTWENVESDALTFSYDDNGQPGLDLRIAKFFSGQGTAEGLDLTGYITSGDYFFDVSFSNLEFLDENDNIFTSVSGGFNVAATPKIIAYIDDVETEFLPLNCNWITSNLLPKFDEENSTFVEPYLPNYKIGIMHLAAGIWKDKKDMRLNKEIKIDVKSLKGKTLSKSLRFNN